EPVDNTSGLLRIDQVVVELTGVLGRFLNSVLGHLVENHAADRNLRLQRLHQVPGDRFALPVGVGGQIQFVDIREQVLQLGDRGLLVGADDVQRGEVVVDIDAETCPGLTLVFAGNVGGTARQVSNVAT